MVLSNKEVLNKIGWYLKEIFKNKTFNNISGDIIDKLKLVPEIAEKLAEKSLIEKGKNKLVNFLKSLFKKDNKINMKI
jgi:hypothetical protein